MTWGQGAGWQASNWHKAYWFGPAQASSARRDKGSGAIRDYSDDDEELLSVIAAWLQVTKGGRHGC